MTSRFLSSGTSCFSGRGKILWICLWARYIVEGTGKLHELWKVQLEFESVCNLFGQLELEIDSAGVEVLKNWSRSRQPEL
jgi:hypothetical protein